MDLEGVWLLWYYYTCIDPPPPPQKKEIPFKMLKMGEKVMNWSKKFSNTVNSELAKIGRASCRERV